MDNIPLRLPTQLLPCLAIPFVEFFPDLCLGWFTPPSLSLDQYKRLWVTSYAHNIILVQWCSPAKKNLLIPALLLRWYLRILLQFIAWFPILEMLLPLSPADESPHFSLICIGTFASVALRNFLMQKQIQYVVSKPLWSTNLPHEKREALFVVVTSKRPIDIHDFDQMLVRFVTYPTRIAAVVMYGLVQLIYQHLGEERCIMLYRMLYPHFSYFR